MNNFEYTPLQIAINIIESYLGKTPTMEGINELFEIHRGNKKVLLEHLHALRDIFNEAIKELEEDE